MKKKLVFLSVLIITVTLVFSFAACTAPEQSKETCSEHLDANHDGICDNDGCEAEDLLVMHDGISDDGDCSTPLYCSCGQLIIGVQSHSFSGTWESNDDRHWHICVNIGCSVTDVKIDHEDSNGDNKCDSCGYNLEVHIHADSDNDGTCDSCTVSVLIDVDLFAVNDMHGKFLPSDVQPGVGGLTSYLKEAQTDNPNTVILSSGDMWQGSAESGLSKGKIINDWMKELGFSFMTIGNHEFDWGGEYISDNVSEELPFLGINIYDKTTNKRVNYAEPSVMVDLGDVQIGFIGAIGDCLSSISGEFTSNLDFVVGDALTELIRAEAQDLRSEGADIIVLSIHSGGSRAISPDYDTSLSDGYIDLVFEAHSHSLYQVQDKYGVWHLQAGGENTSGIFNAEIAYNTVTGSFSVTPALVERSVYGEYPDHELVETVKAMNSDAIEKTTTVIGLNGEVRDSDFLKNLMAQLYAEAGIEKWGESYDIVLGGGYLSCRSPEKLYEGEITYGDLYMLFPFDNALALCEISGSNLDSKFINTANTNYYIYLTEYGNSVKDNIADDSTYYVIADSYNYSYSSNRLSAVEKYVDYTEVFVYARDLLAEYIKNGGLNKVELKANDYNSIEDINAYGALMDAGEATSDKYFTYGTISEIRNETYGNMYIRDDSGNTLYIYGLYDNQGIRYDKMENKPAVGDKIYVYGAVSKYGTVIQMKDAVYAEYKPGDEYYSISELLDYGNSLVSNQMTVESYYTVGIIDSIVSETYGNLYLKDEDGNMIYVYGLYDNQGNRYDKMENKPAVGDTITIYGPIKRYVTNSGRVTVEFYYAVMTEISSSEV